jgi:uncharacterized protein YutE (UPF0331/DUF86 family)
LEPDREVIDVRLARIESCLSQLEPFGELSEMQFLARYDRYREAKKLVAAALATVASIARHLQKTTGRNGEEPMRTLVGMEVLDEEVAERLTRSLRLAGTLNRAHFDEDRDIVYDFVRSELDTLVAFARAVAAWMNGRETA